MSSTNSYPSSVRPALRCRAQRLVQGLILEGGKERGSLRARNEWTPVINTFKRARSCGMIRAIATTTSIRVHRQNCMRSITLLTLGRDGSRTTRFTRIPRKEMTASRRSTRSCGAVNRVGLEPSALACAPAILKNLSPSIRRSSTRTTLTHRAPLREALQKQLSRGVLTGETDDAHLNDS